MTQLLHHPRPAVAVVVNPIVGTAEAEEAQVARKASPALKAFAGSVGGLMEACSLQPIVSFFVCLG